MFCRSRARTDALRAVLEDDGVSAERRKADVEVAKVRQLVALFLRESYAQRLSRCSGPASET